MSERNVERDEAEAMWGRKLVRPTPRQRWIKLLAGLMFATIMLAVALLLWLQLQPG